jgi:Secretion system C-terminal sorting domain
MKRIFHILASTFILTTVYAQTDSVYVQIAGDTVTIWDRNAHENCCIGVVMSSEIRSDSIVVVEHDTSTNYCYCLCYFDFSFSLTNLSPGTYHVSVYRRYTLTTPDSLYLIDTLTFQYGGISSGPTGAVYFMSACHAPAAVKESDYEIPRAVLLPNFPNPFNPVTEIRYQIPDARSQTQEARWVTLKVYDVLGQEVATLVNSVQEPGYQSVKWDAGSFPSGVYYYRMTAGSFVDVKMMVVVK